MVRPSKVSLKALYGYLPEQEAGRLFERLVRKILQEVHPIWSERFQKVVPWGEYASSKGLPSKDVGVDLVGFTSEGEAHAIQVKLWGKPLGWNDLGSFVGVVGNKSYGFTHGLLVAPGGVTQEAERQLSGLPITILTEEALLDGVDLASLVSDRPEEVRRAARKELRPYQREALEAVVRAFVEEKKPRGKLIMPPGTGKTLVALRIAEQVAGKGGAGPLSRSLHCPPGPILKGVGGGSFLAPEALRRGLGHGGGAHLGGRPFLPLPSLRSPHYGCRAAI